MRIHSFKAALAGAWILFALSAARTEAADKVFVGYLYGSPQKLNYKLYTHLCHAFVTADADGTIRPNRAVPDKKFTAEAHAAGVKVLVSLGGWGWDKQFAAMTSNPEAEARYVKSVLKMVDEADYDGIDLDWEYPDTKDEVVGFERLTRTFRRELDAIGRRKERPMFVTMAASSNYGTLKWLRKDFLVETMDWINVMTYDYAGDWSTEAGHNSPLFASSKTKGGRSTAATIDFLLKEQGIPADRLAVGLPLYGKGFNVANPYDSTKGAPKGGLPRGNYAGLARLENDPAWTKIRDDETKTPWLVSKSKKQVVGYDDAESLRLKTEWAMKRGLRGVFFWQVAQDRMPDGSNPLQEAAHAAWAK